MNILFNQYHLCSILLLALSIPLSAQSIATLTQEITTRNPLLQAMDYEYRAALERGAQVDQLPDLEIGVGAFPLPVETRLGPQALRVGATQMFPWWGTLAQREQLERAKARVVYESQLAEGLNILFAFNEQYLELYEARKSQNIIRDNLRLLAALERVALARVESGRASLADVLMVQKEQTALTQKLQLLNLAESPPIAAINQLRQAELSTPIVLTDSLAFTPLVARRDTLEDYLREYHPRLRLLRQRQVVAQEAIALNKLNAKPSFGVGADYILVNPRENATINNNGRDIVQLRAMVRVPLSTKPYRAREREEELRMAAYAQRADHGLTQMLATVERAHSRHAMAALQKEYLETQIETTLAILRILRERYSTEGGDFTELLRLERELIDYRLQLLKAIIDSHRANNQIMQFIVQ